MYESYPVKEGERERERTVLPIYSFSRISLKMLNGIWNGNLLKLKENL